MWLSQNRSSAPAADTGRVTLASGETQAVSGGAELRDAPSYAPYGYAARPPEGTPVLLLSTGLGQVSCGVQSQDGGLSPGEVVIRSAGGAEVRLKNDGTIWLNGAHITPGGQFVPGGGN
ncbi:hypothetical protein [Zongyangia hominis]|uniref:Uncharacterized protein n=1 Tax=Zongyangia hominis TaxID=2763677 RepID=A0A926EDQ0_9FIRM|nr:hypothetical protein [Zongyangia hominis]MBC8570529.1 hypothetical protein [Zongyangia hominis]